MHDEPSDTPETREAINATLRDILSTDGWGQSYWELVVANLNREFGIKTDLLELAQVAPFLPDAFQFGALVEKGVIGSEIRDMC